MSLLYSCTRPVVRVFATAFWSVRAYAAVRVPRTGGLLLAANHQSYLDPVLIGIAASRPLHFVARRTLFRFAPFAWAIRNLHAHPIDRDRGDIGAIRVVLENLRAGRAVVMFPEGTRTRSGRLGEPKEGFARIAARAGVPIVPVLVDGTRRLWPPHNPLPVPGRVNIIFGSPVFPSEGFPGPGDLKKMWVDLSREPHRRIQGGFTDGQSEAR